MACNSTFNFKNVIVLSKVQSHPTGEIETAHYVFGITSSVSTAAGHIGHKSQGGMGAENERVTNSKL